MRGAQFQVCDPLASPFLILETLLPGVPKPRCWEPETRPGSAVAGEAPAPGDHLGPGLGPPGLPAQPGVAGEQLEVGARRAGLDEGVELVGLAGVLPLAGLDQVHLAPAGG